MSRLKCRPPNMILDELHTTIDVADLCAYPANDDGWHVRGL